VRLTKRQEEILGYITGYVAAHRYPPSLREIARHFGIYLRAVQDHLAALVRKGYIEQTRNVSRGLTVTAQGWDFAHFRQVPVIGQVVAGSPVISEENVESRLPISREWLGGGEYFLLRATGDSMWPLIFDGDLILVRHQREANDNDVVIALLNDETTVKRLRKRRDRIVLEADNPAYEKITVKKGDSFQIIGKVERIFREV